MRRYAEDAIRILDRHIEDSDARQAVAEWRPRCATIGRTIDADVRTGVEEARV